LFHGEQRFFARQGREKAFAGLVGLSRALWGVPQIIAAPVHIGSYESIGAIGRGESLAGDRASGAKPKQSFSVKNGNKMRKNT
jgi:hypothetical protein